MGQHPSTATMGDPFTPGSTPLPVAAIVDLAPTAAGSQILAASLGDFRQRVWWEDRVATRRETRRARRHALNDATGSAKTRPEGLRRDLRASRIGRKYRLTRRTLAGMRSQTRAQPSTDDGFDWFR